jgi:drug/metabolite transporter (DMT)-like permease
LWHRRIVAKKRRNRDGASAHHGDTLRAALNVMVFAVVVSGIGPLLVRGSPVDPAATAFWRLFIGLPVALFLIRRSIFLPMRGMIWVAIAGLLLAGDLIFWNGALIRTTILEATILVMVYPVITAIAGHFLFKERITWRFAAGGAVAFGGLMVMMLHAGARGSSSLIGDLMAIAAAFFYAGSLMISARMCRAYDTLKVSFWLIFWAAAAAAPIGLMEARPFPVTLHDWLYIIGYAALTLFGYSLFNRSLKVVPTSIASLMGYAQPAVASVLGAIFLKEIPPWNGILGAIVIVAGLVLATRHSAPAAPEPDPKAAE